MSDTFEFDDRNKAERFVGTLHDPAATTGDVLTVQADKSIAAQPGGGGSGGVQVVTVPVSSAQILDLFNTPVVLIPGVAGKVIVVNGVGIVYLAGLVPYLDGGGNISISTLALSNNANWVALNGAGFWDQATSQVLTQGYGSNQAAGTVAEWAGTDVSIFISGGGNPTLGDGTLLVTLSYFLAPTV